ncbi:MAG: glycoside hydrolase family 3 N-terminal domain-containing protein, partial [Chloroflexota bacterium]
ANPSIGALDRSYSADPDVVVEMASAAIGGQHEHGVVTTLKHFPGLGSATGDTDREFVDITDTWAPVELEPFRRLIDVGLADVVMTANAVNGQLDRRYPASLSRATLDLLRTDLGWTGPTITDDLGAGSIRDSYSNDEALRRALNAGNDLLLLANTGPVVAEIAAESVASIVGQVDAGRIDPARITEATARIQTLLTRLSGPKL